MTLLAYLAYALVVLALLRVYSNRLRRRSFDRHTDEAMAVANPEALTADELLWQQEMWTP